MLGTSPTKIPMRRTIIAMRPLIATRHATSLQTPHPSRKPCSYTLGSILLASTLSLSRRVEINSI